MMRSVNGLLEESLTVGLASGCVDDGSRNGKRETPAVAMIAATPMPLQIPS